MKESTKNLITDAVGILVIWVLANTLFGCAPHAHIDGDTVPEFKRPSAKYHFGDKVIVHSNFYGNCIATVTTPPWWSEACAVDGNPQPDHLYFFSEMQCRGGSVSGTSALIERCERGLKRVK